MDVLMRNFAWHCQSWGALGSVLINHFLLLAGRHCVILSGLIIPKHHSKAKETPHFSALASPRKLVEKGVKSQKSVSP